MAELDQPIKCSCCGLQTLAMAKPDGTIVIQDRRHGKTHTVEIPTVRVIALPNREF